MLPISHQLILCVSLFLHIAGGSVVLLYAAKYRDIGGIINLAGRYDLKSGIEKRLGENYLERLKKDGYIDVKTKTGVICIYLSNL